MPRDPHPPAATLQGGARDLSPGAHQHGTPGDRPRASGAGDQHRNTLPALEKADVANARSLARSQRPARGSRGRHARHLGLRVGRRAGHRHLELARVDDLHLLGGLAALAAHRLHRLDDIQALDDLAKDDVLAVEPRRLDGADEELAAVGARARVGHRERARARVLQLEVLVRELLAVDGLAARAVAAREIAALQHKLRDDAVEDGVLEVERLARLAHALLAGGERPEVLGSLGHGLAVETHHDATRGLAANLDVEEDLVGDLRALGGRRASDQAEQEQSGSHS
mmetsp:Transcript_23988/g.59555  ORF Transcript_23988/g.59555 Transcript_23988/m.59555 type:complete len:284 (+) Transcript_23988:144-995(+)